MTLMETAELLGNFGEFIGAVVVAATLIYLTIQIRHNTSMTRAAMRQARSDWYMNQVGVFANSDYLPVIMDKFERGEQLDAIEKRRFDGYTQAWHRASEITLLQFGEGLVDQVVIDGMKVAFRAMIRDGSGMFHNWEYVKSAFDPAYVRFVESTRE